MLLSPINGIIIKLPFRSQWLVDNCNGLSQHRAPFSVNSCFGFGLRFLNRQQQTLYLKACEISKKVLGVAAVYLTVKAIAKLFN